MSGILDDSRRSNGVACTRDSNLAGESINGNGLRRVDDILLADSIARLRFAIRSGVCGALVSGSDSLARRAVALAVAPDALILSCCASSTPAKIRQIRDDKSSQIDHGTASKAVVLYGIDSESAEIVARLALDTFDIVIALAATERNVAPSLRRAGRLEARIQLGPSTMEKRALAWELLLTNIPADTCSDISVAAKQFAAVSPGFSLIDFRNVAYQFASSSSSSHGKSIEHLIRIVRNTKPHLAAGLEFVEYGSSAEGDSSTGGCTFTTTSDGSFGSSSSNSSPWARVGGYKELLSTIRRLVHWPVVHADTFARLRIEPLRGLLLHGPSGCGKSLIASALLESLDNANWLKLDGTALFSKYLGDSEARVRAAFAQARTLEPCVVFIDDLEIVCGSRQDSDNGVERRVLGAFLAELDGVTSGSVFVVACTSQIDQIDPAVIRNGRIDSIMHVGYPDEDDRKEILDVFLSAMAVEQKVSLPELEPESDAKSHIISYLASATDGLSGGDLAEICREAALLAMREEEYPQCVKYRHFLDAVSSMKRKRCSRRPKK